MDPQAETIVKIGYNRIWKGDINGYARECYYKPGNLPLTVVSATLATLEGNNHYMINSEDLAYVLTASLGTLAAGDIIRLTNAGFGRWKIVVSSPITIKGLVDLGNIAYTDRYVISWSHGATIELVALDAASLYVISGSGYQSYAFTDTLYTFTLTANPEVAAVITNGSMELYQNQLGIASMTINPGYTLTGNTHSNWAGCVTYYGTFQQCITTAAASASWQNKFS